MTTPDQIEPSRHPERNRLLTALGYTLDDTTPETHAVIKQSAFGGATLEIQIGTAKPDVFPVSDLTDRQRAALDALMKGTEATWPFGDPTP